MSQIALYLEYMQAHFLICFLALLFYRLLDKKLDYKYTCETTLDTLEAMNFAKIQEQGLLVLPISLPLMIV